MNKLSDELKPQPAYSRDKPFVQSEFVENSEENGNTIQHELIDSHIQRLCKQLCYGNRFDYLCTLDDKWSRPPTDAVLCEWGNASYDWMLSELEYLQKQNAINGREVLQKRNYYNKILSSTPFWERYKNWRFKRRLRVPDYIKALDPDARQVFWWLHDQDNAENIAQRLRRNSKEIKRLINDIQLELAKRHRSYLLEPDIEYSLETLNPVDSENFFSFETQPEKQELQQKIKYAYQQLSWLEQFVLDSMVVDGLKADSVLSALKSQSLSLSEKLSCEQMNVQHVYYFLRKTISKLKETAGMQYD